MVPRLEYGPQGPKPRFAISSRFDDGFKLYYEQCCGRSDMENRVKDQQLDLFAERMSAGTLRLKLIKVDAVIIRNTRRIRVLMSDRYPYKKDLSALAQRLVAT